MQQGLLKVLLLIFFLFTGSAAHAVDWLAPVKGLKNLFGGDDSIVIWQGPGQFVKIVEQDWDHDHRRAPKNEHPATISAPHLAVVLFSLQAWRPEDSPESDRSVRLFTDDEISLIAPKLADALGRAGPKQDVVFGVTGNYDNFSRDRRRATAGRMFVNNGKLNIIFGDVLRPVFNEDPDDISEYDRPHRAGKRMEMTSSDNIVRNGIGIDHYTYIERPRLDWIQVDVPEVVAAYQGPQLVNPVPVVNESYPADGALSKENRKLREQLARMRKETGETQAPAVMSKPQPSASESLTQPQPRQPASEPLAQPQPQYTRPAAPANAASSASGNRMPPDNIPTPAELDSIQKRLQLLKQLHDQGLITDQEYNAKRKEIVEQI